MFCRQTTKPCVVKSRMCCRNTYQSLNSFTMARIVAFLTISAFLACFLEQRPVRRMLPMLRLNTTHRMLIGITPLRLATTTHCEWREHAPLTEIVGGVGGRHADVHPAMLTGCWKDRHQPHSQTSVPTCRAKSVAMTLRDYPQLSEFVKLLQTCDLGAHVGPSACAQHGQCLNLQNHHFGHELLPVSTVSTVSNA